MSSTNSKLTKLENTPAVQRLALVRDLTTEDLEAVAGLQALLRTAEVALGETIAELCQFYVDAIHEHTETLQRVKNKTPIKYAVPSGHCGDFNITYDCEYHVDEFTLLDRIHKAIVAAGLDPVQELTRLADEWESKTNDQKANV